MTDIVAFRIDGWITNDPRLIIAALKMGADFEPLTRDRMRFMAALDLGTQWERLAHGRTLFTTEQLDELLSGQQAY